MGVACVDCSAGQGTFCLYVDTQGMQGSRVDLTSTNPESGQVQEGLIEVTDEMVAHWTELGYRP